MSHWLRNFRIVGFGALGIVLGAVGYFSLRSFARFDPFAKYKADYSNPLGSGIGAQMRDVKVTVYSKNEKSLSFDAAQVDMRRDQQYFRIAVIRNGQVYDNGSVAAKFQAGVANYDGTQKTIEVSGAPRVKNDDMDLVSDRIKIDREKKSISVEDGVKGRYKNGQLSAQKFSLQYEKKNSVVIGFMWTGPLELMGQEGSKPAQRTVQIRGDKWEHFSNPERDIYYDAEAIDQDSILRAKKITYDRKADVITAEGECEYFGPDAILSAPVVTVYRKEKRALCTGAVKIYVKPEKNKGKAASVPPTGDAGIVPPAQPNLPPGLTQPKPDRPQGDQVRSTDNAREYPIVVTCTKVEYFYTKGSKKALISGSPKARQDLGGGAWREVTAPLAIYEEEKELLTLLSEDKGQDVRVTNSTGDDMMGEMIVISTEEGNRKVTGTRMVGIMKVDEEEETKPSTPPPATKPPTGGGGGRR